ncbi:MAG: electron transfer flavoprotein subunit alpha/FixB family protein [Actinomycetia bacterium]|nr:electron transfer flavoprotein subunit alpha/FixB family protein [Actinomycetes bacterium]
MAVDCWVLATDERRLTELVAVAAGAGGLARVVAVGSRGLAEAAAAAGADAVTWVETAPDAPAEACAGALARELAAAGARLVLAGAAPAARALLGAVAAALDAVVVAGARAVRADGATLLAQRADLGGRVIETVATTRPLAAVFGGEEVEPARAAKSAPTAPITQLTVADWADVRVEATEAAPGAGDGLASADRVVGVGRGLKAKADLALVVDLAAALGAELACSMPIADDYGWLAKERYLGRSGQQVAPRCYLAIGISGTPQHLEGVRGAKVVVAVNSDPGAPIFRRADYGIVGDLYQVVPAITEALSAR